jgi:hypothetical protein
MDYYLLCSIWLKADITSSAAGSRSLAEIAYGNFSGVVFAGCVGGGRLRRLCLTAD